MLMNSLFRKGMGFFRRVLGIISQSAFFLGVLFCLRRGMSAVVV